MNAEEAQHVKHLADVFEEAVGQNKILSSRVAEVLDTNRTSRKVLIVLTVIAALFGLLSIPVLYTTANIYSCTTPEGVCAKRNGANLQITILAVTYRSELERNKTELQLAQQRNDQGAIAFRTQRVAALEAQLAELVATKQ